MPLFFQQDIDLHTKIAIWKIEEEASFFSEKVPLQRTITHPHKRLQHLSGRYLLQYLFPHFPINLIQIADTKRPFLEDEAFHFSISHCGDFAAVIVSKNKRVGIDIELKADKIARIRHKFISEQERSIIDESLPDHLKHLTICWSCKEAVFKWYGKGNVDFRKHIVIQNVSASHNNSYSTQLLFKKNEDLVLSLHSLVFDDLVLSYVFT